MAEIKGYLLTKEEEKACLDLIKKLRSKRTFAINFSGCVRVKAKTPQEANDIFWLWVRAMQDETSIDWDTVITQSPYFEREDVEEE